MSTSPCESAAVRLTPRGRRAAVAGTATERALRLHGVRDQEPARLLFVLVG
jgi:hypothetical protein